MAVAFDAKSSADSRVGSATSHNHTNMTVGTGSNRALVVLLTFNSSSGMATPTVTWDSGGTNQSCTLIAAHTADADRHAFLFGLVAPTSGNKTLAISWSGTRECYCCCIAFTGVDQTGGATSFPGGTEATGNNTTSSVTVTSATGDYVVAVHNSGNDAFTSVNNTQIYIDNSGFNCSAGNYAAGAASVTMTGTIASTSIWGAAGTSVKAAGGAATKAPPPFHRSVRFR